MTTRDDLEALEAHIRRSLAAPGLSPVDLALKF